jgi:uncharacterized coiled-coil DUF342 family protein
MRVKSRGVRLSLLALLTGVMCTGLPVQAAEMSMSEFLSAVGDVDVPATVPPPAPPASGHVPLQPGAVAAPGESPAALRAENRRLQGVLARAQAQNDALRREHTSGLAQLQTRLAAAEGRVAQLQVQNHDLAVKADQRSLMLTPAQPAPDADLQARLSALKAERDRLRAQAASGDAQSGALRSQLTALTAERDDLRRQAGELKVQVLSLTGLADSLKVAQGAQKDAADAAGAKLAALTAERDTLKKASGDAQARLAALTKELSTARAQAGQAGRDAAAEQALRDKRDGLRQQLADLQKTAQQRDQAATAAQAQIQALGAQRDRMQQQIAALSAKAVVAPADSAASETVRQGKQQAQQQAQLKAQQALADLTGKVTALTGQVADLTAQRDSLQAKVTQADAARADTPAAPAAPAPPALETETDRQTYASGVVLAGNLKRSLALQQDLGVKPVPGLLLAGLTDAVNGTVRLDAKDVDDSYRAMVKQLSVLEEGKYRDGEKRLEKLTMFFLQDKKGAGVIRAGDKVRFDLTESVPGGRTLRDNHGVTTAVTERLPYMVGQALTLAGRGGGITVYCLVSDVYPPEQIPDGLFAYTLLKYTFRVADK